MADHPSVVNWQDTNPAGRLHSLSVGLTLPEARWHLQRVASFLKTLQHYGPPADSWSGRGTTEQPTGRALSSGSLSSMRAAELLRLAYPALGCSIGGSYWRAVSPLPPTTRIELPIDVSCRPADEEYSDQDQCFRTDVVPRWRHAPLLSPRRRPSRLLDPVTNSRSSLLLSSSLLLCLSDFVPSLGVSCNAVSRSFPAL
jgi:hypothetical protein